MATEDLYRDIQIAQQGTGSLQSAAAFFASALTVVSDPQLIADLKELQQRLGEDAAELHHYAMQRITAEEEAQQKAAGESEDVSDDRFLALYDQRAVLDRGPDNVKWYNPFTDLGDRSGRTRRTKKKGLCAHCTAVPGGFGVHKGRVRFWESAGLDWTPSVPQPNGELAQASWVVQPSAEVIDNYSGSDLEAYARMMAIGDRYRGFKPQKYNYGVPYQGISAANSCLYYNLPFEWVTFHGNGANTDFLGYAWDGHSKKDTITDGPGKYQASDLLADCERLVDDARAEGHSMEEITCHGCWTPKPFDPGKDFILMVLVPLSESRNMKIDWDFKTNGGISMREMVA